MTLQGPHLLMPSSWHEFGRTQTFSPLQSPWWAYLLEGLFEADATIFWFEVSAHLLVESEFRIFWRMKHRPIGALDREQSQKCSGLARFLCPQGRDSWTVFLTLPLSLTPLLFLPKNSFWHLSCSLINLVVLIRIVQLKHLGDLWCESTKSQLTHPGVCLFDDSMSDGD